MTKISCWLGFVIFPALLLAQRPYNSNFQQEYFFGRLPGVKTEAMGLADVAVGGTVPSLFLNPAAIGLIRNWEAVAVNSAPFFVLRESDNYFLGYAQRINSRMTGAVSLNQFAMGPSSFDITIGNTKYPVDKPKVSNLALSFAGELLEGLQAGININYLHWTYIDEVPAAKTFHADAGLLYRLPLTEAAGEEKGASRMQFGASLANFSFAKINFKGPAGEEASNVFPAIFRIGAAWFIDTEIPFPEAGMQPLSLVVTAEYQDLLNNEFRTAFRLGSEAVLFHVLALRMGLYTQSEDDLGLSINDSRYSDFTFGFGIIVPFARLTKSKWPFNMHVDYTSLKQKSGITGRLPNMRGFSIRLVAPLDN